MCIRDRNERGGARRGRACNGNKGGGGDVHRAGKKRARRGRPRDAGGGARQRSGVLGGASGKGRTEGGGASVEKGNSAFGGDGGQCGRAGSASTSGVKCGRRDAAAEMRRLSEGGVGAGREDTGTPYRGGTGDEILRGTAPHRPICTVRADCEGGRTGGCRPWR